ncbi:MAG: ABC transporter ATP-binding protein [Propionibacteriaceae bacterium]|nr:ABC transporter ATP-binding protein [Propionibacteriaceae bacterium]
MGTIEIKGLTREFKGTVAVDQVDLTIRDGELVVLLGPSGCGKTTLLRMIAGILEPTSGTISLDGQDITDLPAKKRDIAMVFQSYALYPHLSAYKNLAFPLASRRLGKAETDSKVQAVAASLELSELLDRKPKQLSGGQRQRVAVGRALVRDPRAFLMDEPLSNLDATLRTQTRQELVRLHRKLGTTFVYVTHDQVEAMTMATQIVVLNHGRIEQTGSPSQVYDQPASAFVASFVGSPAMNLMPATVVTQAQTVCLAGKGFEVRLWPGQTEPIDVTFGVRPEHLRVLSPGEEAEIEFLMAVDSIENLGHEEAIYGLAEGTRICLRRPRGWTQVRLGVRRVGFDRRHLHLFERASGRRLEWVPDDVDRLGLADDVQQALAGVA